MKTAIRSIVFGVSVIGLVAAANAAATPQAPHHYFKIASQPARSGLIVFARQANIQVLVSAEDVRDIRLAPLSGGFTVRDGINQLLESTQLRLVSFDGKTAVIGRNPVRRIALMQAPAAPARGASSAAPAVARPPAARMPEEETASNNPADIVITGSRVIANGNNSPTPVTVVSVAQLTQAAPSNVPDALNRLPIFAGSSNQSSFSNASANFTGNYLNLRRVGIARTLILFDGHRVPPTTQDGLIDTNTIPQLLLQRVDVVTGGASAVYGSDAITGVVNFIVDKTFEGIKLNAQSGLSSRSDNGSYRLGAAFGTELFGGRGHFEASFERYNSEGIDNKLGRAYGRAVYTTQGGGTAANPYRLITNTRIANTSRYGYITNVASNGTLRDQVFANADGTLRPFVHGAPTGTTGIESGGDGGFYTSTLQASLRSSQGFARLDYDLTSDIHAYVQGTASQSHNQYSKENIEVRNYVLSAQNAFLPAQYRQAFASQGINTFTFSKLFTETPRQTPKAWIKNWFVIGGLNGSLGSKLNWDVAASTSESRQRVASGNNVNAGRIIAGIDAVRAPDGSIVCNVTLTNPGLYPGCVPINLFGERTVSPAAQNYIFKDTQFHAVSRLQDITGTVSGSLFDTWAGPVKMALSGEYRHLYLDVQSEVQPLDRTNCTGLRYNCNANTPIYLSNVVADARNRNQNITEGAFEVDVPLLRDFFLARSLNFNGAARYTYYDTSGKAITWKAGLDWHVTDDITVRGTRSRDIRAPNLNDLFSPVNVNPAGFFDQHTGITATVPVQSQGNSALVPEVANTTTLGIVYRPSWLPRFSVAVDYFKINISKGLGSVSGNNSSVQSECELSNGTSSLCALFNRPLPFSDRSAANFPTLVLSRPLNLSTLTTHGIDTEVNYSAPLFGGNASVRGLLSYQPSLVSKNFPTSVAINAAGAAGLPTYRVTGFLNYAHSNISFNLLQRWHSSTKQSGDPTLVFAAARVLAAAYTDVTLSYLFKRSGGQAEVFLTVQNLFDKQPAPFLGTAGPSSVPGYFIPATNGDDPIGRYFTAGARFRF